MNCSPARGYKCCCIATRTSLPPRWADRQDGCGELGAPGWLDPGGISMMGGLGVWRTKPVLSGASCGSFPAWSGGGVRGQEQPGGRWLLVLAERGRGVT
jgi:hypothetical protein